MPRFSAIVSGTHGAGRVVLISSHLEDGEPAARRLLRSCLRFAARKPVSEARHAQADERVRKSVRDAWLAVRKNRYKPREVATDQNRALSRLLAEARRRNRGPPVSVKPAARRRKGAGGAAAKVAEKKKPLAKKEEVLHAFVYGACD